MRERVPFSCLFSLTLMLILMMIYKGMLNTKELEVPGCRVVNQRVKLRFGGNVPDDGVKI